jgi:hypothetical protein
VPSVPSPMRSSTGKPVVEWDLQTFRDAAHWVYCVYIRAVSVVEERPSHAFEVAGAKFRGNLMMTHEACERFGGVAQGRCALRETHAALNLIG